MPPSLLHRLSPFFSKKFLKFCLVGASGVGVNLGVLALLSAFEVRTSYASAWAIEISIISNFLMNEVWTFKEQSTTEGRMWRGIQFQGVSLIGGIVQWVTALAVGILIFMVMASPEAAAVYFGDDLTLLERYLWLPIETPPDIGAGKYWAQLVGIGIATVWNYLANFYWTWRATSPD